MSEYFLKGLSETMNTKELKQIKEQRGVQKDYTMTESASTYQQRVQAGSVADVIVQLNRAQRRAMKKVKK